MLVAYIYGRQSRQQGLTFCDGELQMSIKAMVWAWAQDIEARDKLVLMPLADHADDDGICWPGIKGVAVKNRISERAAQRHLANLQELGLLEVTPQYRPDGSRTTNLYRLVMTPTSPPGVKSNPPSDTASHLTPEVSLVTLASPPGEPGVTGPVTLASPHESPLNPHRTTKAVVEVDEVFRTRMRAKYLDTLSEVDERINEALAHSQAGKYQNKQLYVQGWLRRDAEHRNNGGADGKPRAGSAEDQRRTVYRPKVDAAGRVILGH